MVSRGRQRERDLAGSQRVKQGPVVFVEGGAKGELARRAARAFGVLFQQLNLPMMPKVIACGGRRATYERFVEVPRLGHWAHVKQRPGDRWPRPPAAKDTDLCFMALVMETWCLAEFDHTKKGLEKVGKADIYDQLTRATRQKWDSRQKAASFDWLEKVNARQLRQSCSEFERLAKRLGAA